MNQNSNIGLYHPQLMSRIAITHLLNLQLSNRVKHVGHLFDLFSASYPLVILIEPEVSSVKYNPQLIASFISSVTKPIIVVPFYERETNKSSKNVTFLRCNPKTKELIACIKKIEEDQLAVTTT